MDILSLFSGAGGLDLGLMIAGHRILWANDNDPDCVKTYKENIGNHIIEGGIESIDTSDIPDADAVIGGFPCQGFSCANLRRSPEDTRNRMYLELRKILRVKRPKYFLAEN